MAECGVRANDVRCRVKPEYLLVQTVDVPDEPEPVEHRVMSCFGHLANVIELMVAQQSNREIRASLLKAE